jgi:cyclopropane fatty-acyl-phospholipid synthase-like methyltransferase
MADKPDAPSCERNREPILAVLREHFKDRHRLLEIGSGTGQHAIFLAAALPHLLWQTSDRQDKLAGIQVWLNDAALSNTPAPLELDVGGTWPRGRFDAVFSANTLHIMSWDEVETLFARLPDVLRPDAKLAVYGPFNYGGRFTSPSNAAFDTWLKGKGSHQGIRDVEAVQALAGKAGLALVADHAMPSNNRCLVWHRRAVAGDSVTPDAGA